jgi:S1-C subfamily serine protease
VRLASQGATLVGAGAAGAAIAVGIVAAAGALGGTTTTVREVVEETMPETAAFARAGGPLSVHDVYMRSAPGVVQVTAAGTGRASGSGFVIDKAGHIVTSFSVVEGAGPVEVSFSNDERQPARIVGRDPSTDLALLQVKARSRALTPLALGDSDSVQVGDSVVAIGNPLGEDRSVTAGIVSAFQRSIAGPNGAPIDHVIQTDAALNRGNAGGPLLDGRGRVIGVSTELQSPTGADGYAIPVNTVKDVAAQLIASGVVEHAFAGLDARAISAQVATLYRLPVRHGLLVGGVCRGDGAAKAGVRGATRHVTLAGVTWPLGGDIIVRIDGVPIASVSRLREIVGAKRPGDWVDLALVRGDRSMDVRVKLGRQPLSPGC